MKLMRGIKVTDEPRGARDQWTVFEPRNGLSDISIGLI
jgi:hypothetical protein